MTIEYYEGVAGLWYWRLKSANGKIIADGAEGYTKKGNVIRAAEKLVLLFRDAPIQVKELK